MKEAHTWFTSASTCTARCRKWLQSRPTVKSSGIGEFNSRPEAFAEIVGDLPTAPAGVAFDATYGWGWFADLLADLGLAAHMSHPKGTKAISAARVKNDAVDAETLAQLLRTNLLPESEK